MKALAFIRIIFKKFPFLLMGNGLLLLAANLLDAASIFSLVAVADLFLNENLQGASLITKRIAEFFSHAGFLITLGWAVAIFLCFNIFKICFQILAQFTILKTKYAMLRDIMLGTYEDFFNARWQFFSSNKQGVLINTFIREMNVLGDALSAMGRYFSGLFQIALYLVLPVYLSWQVTAISVSSAVIFALPFLWLGKFAYRFGKMNTSTANQVGSVIHEDLNLAKIILGFGRQGNGLKSLAAAFDAHRKATLRSQTFNFSMPLAYFPFGILVLIIGLFAARRLTLPLSETAVLFYALARIIPLIGNFTEQKTTLDNLFPSYEQIVGLRRKAKDLRQGSGERLFRGINNEIAIEGLSFQYPGHKPVLENINIRIPRGKMVAIVGESGSGKSTLIDIIMGFNEPAAGSVSVDGIRLQEFDINSYRHALGYVPQDSVLFNMSIRDNLLWACDSVSREEIVLACRQANAEEFIEKFPRGYDTMVGDRGVRLSGGQIQRVALARAILRRPQLLILDEATSALDTHSERLIQQAIENIARETTVVVVAHRLSTIVNSDYIYVLKGGAIIEEGPYPELVKNDGSFRRMARLQALEAAK